LVELAIVIAVMAFVAGTVSLSLSSFNSRETLEQKTQILLSLFEEARGRTLASDQNSVYGIHLEEDKAVLFKGNIYTEGSVTNKEITFSPYVRISDISLEGGASEVIFDRLTGYTDTPGTITLSTDSSVTSVITVFKSGVVE